MAKRIYGKVMWLGRATSALVGLAVLVALGVGVANSALAHTNVDTKLFHLGHSNSTTRPTALVGTLSDAVKSVLVVQNKSRGPALSLGVAQDQAPLKVNPEAGTATDLSADELDGLDSSEFLGKTEKAQDAAHADHADSATNAQDAANADTVDGKSATDFYAQGSKVADSDLLDGQNSTAFLGANARAADADKLDGKDSSDFLQGRGAAKHGALAFSAGDPFVTTFLEMPDPGIRVGYQCPSNLASTGVLRIRNLGSETVNLFSDNGGTNPNHFGQLAPNAAFDQATNPSGEFITFQVQGSYVATIEVFTVHRSSDCHAQAQALVTKP